MTLSIDSLARTHEPELTELQSRLAYRFQDVRLLQKALIHRSFAFEKGKPVGKDNERLEFLGDAVLDLVVGHAIFQRFPEMREGEMTRLRAALVNESHLARMAEPLGLGDFLLLGRGEDASQGRRKPSILSSAYEALVGAVFLDGGYPPVAELVQHQFGPWISKSSRGMSTVDPKSRLQELLQEKYCEPPAYFLEMEEGPAHRKQFTVSVRFRDTVLGTGCAHSKKEAEQQAAARALAFLELNGDLPAG